MLPLARLFLCCMDTVSTLHDPPPPQRLPSIITGTAPGLASSPVSLSFRSSCGGSKPSPLLPWSLLRSGPVDVGVRQVEPASQQHLWYLATWAGPLSSPRLISYTEMEVLESLRPGGL